MLSRINDAFIGLYVRWRDLSPSSQKILVIVVALLLLVLEIVGQHFGVIDVTRGNAFHR